MYSDEKREKIRQQVKDYLDRNRISPSSLATIMKMRPATLLSFMDHTIKAQYTTVRTIEKWLQEYDLVDFRRK